MAVTINMHNVKVKDDAKLMTDAAIVGESIWILLRLKEERLS